MSLWKQKKKKLYMFFAPSKTSLRRRNFKIKKIFKMKKKIENQMS